MNSDHNIKISRHYKNRMDERKKLQSIQSPIHFPPSEETKQKFTNHVKEIGMLSYDKLNDVFWGVYRGVKVVCDVMEKNCKFYSVNGENENYFEADEEDIYRALNF